MPVEFQKFEGKWQKAWQKAGCFEAQDHSSKPKYYALDMFPYPSGQGLHIGHLASYTPTDIVSRYKRACGYNVLHPMGYDAFGLPAEQYAIQTGVHPRETTNKAIENFRRQLKSFGYSFDWGRELSTCEPSYYKWTQKIMKLLFQRGLAYQKQAPVNWCPALRTVLANEEVVDGKSERGGHPVQRLPMKQWMLKITTYADKLLEGLENLDWPEATRAAQRNWIGKSTGASVYFSVQGHDSKIEVYTTRPDTLFGATFMVLAPEHPLVLSITKTEQRTDVQNYIQQSALKSELDRVGAQDTSHKTAGKTGVFTGAYAINPLNKQAIPIWIADYVLMDYGTGAIMAVPAHDERDFEFATTCQLKIVRVLDNADELPTPNDGKLINSDFLNGLNKQQAIATCVEYLEANQLGQKKTQYKLRDWLFSRQRYWGEPFPFVEYEDGKIEAVDDDELPVLLPEVADYQPTEKGEPPLARCPEWVQYKKGDRKGQRTTDTMPGWAGSSWYFLRYIDPHNTSALCDPKLEKYWMPVDLYIGGAEHSVLHLLYARFWHRVLYEEGWVSTPEPIAKLRHQGVVMGPDGQRMSKSRGNIINPDKVHDQYGADVCRLYISFMGPFEKDKSWSPKGIEGVSRFVDRVWRVCVDEADKITNIDPAHLPAESASNQPAQQASNLPAEQLRELETLHRLCHKTIKKVGQDIETLNFNTAVSAMMILANALQKAPLRPHFILKHLAQLLMPFAPHLAEELWHRLGGEGLVAVAPWPTYDKALVVDDTVNMGVQVNGRMRGTIELSRTASQAEALALAEALPRVQQALQNLKVHKVIYHPGRILNLVAK